MRVLYSFPHRVGATGIGSTAYHQIRGAAAAGVDIVLYCTSLDRQLPGSIEIVETLKLAGRRIPHRALGVDRAYRYHDARVAAAIRRRSDIDVVHAWPRASAKTFAVARDKGIRCVREVPNAHTAYAFEAVAREFERLGMVQERTHSHYADSKILDREEREYELADVVLVPSAFVRDTFLARGIPAEKLVLHAYGFDEDRCYPRLEAGPTDGRGLNALFVGSCEPRKGLHYALEAWLASGAAESGRFVICGAFVPGYRDVLKRWLVHPSVEVVGHVNDPATLMRESDVLLLPSIEEGSAIVTYEAQACGCVVLASDAAGARIDDGHHGLVHAAGDVEALTSQLAHLDRDRDFLARLRQATLDHRDEITWERAAIDVTEVYAGRTTAADRSPTRT